MVWKPPVREKAATWLRTSPPGGGADPSCLAKVHISSQVMHTIHHRQPDGVCGLSAASVRARACTRERLRACGGGAGYCWRAAALLAGVGFNWNTQRAAPMPRWKLWRQAHTDWLQRWEPTPTTPSLPSPEGQPHQGLHDFLNTHAPHSQTARVSARHVRFKSLGSLTRCCVELH